MNDKKKKDINDNYKQTTWIFASVFLDTQEPNHVIHILNNTIVSGHTQQGIESFLVTLNKG